MRRRDDEAGWLDVEASEKRVAATNIRAAYAQKSPIRVQLDNENTVVCRVEAEIQMLPSTINLNCHKPQSRLDAIEQVKQATSVHNILRRDKLVARFDALSIYPAKHLDDAHHRVVSLLNRSSTST